MQWAEQKTNKYAKLSFFEWAKLKISWLKYNLKTKLLNIMETWTIALFRNFC